MSAAGGVNMEIREYGRQDAGTVLIQPVDEHDLEGMDREVARIREKAGEEFRLLTFRVQSWNHDLSPWPAPAVWGKESFGDGAADTLREILKVCTDRSKTYYIGGYSLAGLFALWAVYQTDAFAGAAAASPSVWFPGFTDWMKERRPECGAVYLSLGDREERTRNPVMATVGDQIRAAYALLQEQGVDCTLEWNRGNHFRDNDIRTAKAFAWLIRHRISS
jgi:hypothetical protein